MLYYDPQHQKPISPIAYQPYAPAVPVTDRTQGVQSPAFYNTRQPGMARPPIGPPPEPRRSGARGAAIFALTILLALVFGIGLFSGWQFARSSGSASPAASATSQPATNG